MGIVWLGFMGSQHIGKDWNRTMLHIINLALLEKLPGRVMGYTILVGKEVEPTGCLNN